MNKKIKRIVAAALVISAFSTIEPSKYLDLMGKKAYAEIKRVDLDSISLGYGSIDFKASKTDYSLKLDSKIDTLKIKAVPKDEEAEVSINGNVVTASDDYKKEVELDKGSNTINITVRNGSNKKKTYTLTVIRGNEEVDQIYLDDIKLSAGDITFSRDKIDYNVNVPSETSDISIKATPKDTDYDEEINGVTATDDDNYKRTVNLSYGNNDVTIRIRDKDDHEKIYTLHINRPKADLQAQGTNATSNGQATSSTSATNAASTVVKGWALNNGQWNYIEDSGSKAVYWKQLNGIWYYFGEDGVMKTGWQNVNGDWYYLDENGMMKTGWIEVNGKWYYSYVSGVMAKNAVIDGYKLDVNGVWIK